MNEAVMQVHRYPDAAAFIQRAEPWLLQAEAEHNLLLGLAQKLTTTTDGYDPPIYLATLEDEGTMVGCAFRTPPHKLGLTRMPPAAVPVLMEDLLGVYATLPAVLGPEAEARAFAAAWSRRTGIQARAGRRQRIYQLETVTPLRKHPPGHLRLAEPGDLILVADWAAGFSADTAIPNPNPAQAAQAWIARQSMYLWDDGGPVSMAAWAGSTPNGARIGYVYTPPSLRGRGYASAATAALSRQVLDTGCRFCFLYTDLANPTSNSIYQRIGYRPVCDVMDYDFLRP